MIVVLGSCIYRRRLYCLVPSYRMGGYLVTRIPASRLGLTARGGPVRRIPVIEDEPKEIDKEIRLRRGRPRISSICPRQLRRLILNVFSNEIIDEPRHYNPFEAFSRIRVLDPTIKEFFVITSRDLFNMRNASPEQLVSRFLIKGGAVVMIA